MITVSQVSEVIAKKLLVECKGFQMYAIGYEMIEDEEQMIRRHHLIMRDLKGSNSRTYGALRDINIIEGKRYNVRKKQVESI